MADCTVTGCDRRAIAKGLCRMHYSRARRGAPLVDTGPAKGDRDGHGRYGILSETPDGLLCHECGHRYTSLGAHVAGAHEMTAREYKLAHELPLSKGLVTRSLRERYTTRSRAQIDTPAWRRLEAARDPQAAADSRDPEMLSRAARDIRDPDLPAANGRAGRTRRINACANCGVRWCPLPGYYRRRTCSPECLAEKARREQLEPVSDRDRAIRAARAAGISAAKLAEMHGVTPTRIRQIVRAQAFSTVCKC